MASLPPFVIGAAQQMRHHYPDRVRAELVQVLPDDRGIVKLATGARMTIDFPPNGASSVGEGARGYVCFSRGNGNLPWWRASDRPKSSRPAADDAAYFWPCFGSDAGRSWTNGSVDVDLLQFGALVVFGGSPDWVFQEAVALGDILVVREQDHPLDRLATYPVETISPGEEDWAPIVPVNTAALESMFSQMCATLGRVFVLGATTEDPPGEPLGDPYGFPWQLRCYNAGLVKQWDAENVEGGDGGIHSLTNVLPVDGGIAFVTYTTEFEDFTFHPTPFLCVYSVTGAAITPRELEQPPEPTWLHDVWGVSQWSDSPPYYTTWDIYAPSPVDGDIYDPGSGGGDF